MRPAYTGLVTPLTISGPSPAPSPLTVANPWYTLCACYSAYSTCRGDQNLGGRLSHYLGQINSAKKKVASPDRNQEKIWQQPGLNLQAHTRCAQSFRASTNCAILASEISPPVPLKYANSIFWCSLQKLVPCLNWREKIKIFVIYCKYIESSNILKF